MPLTHRPTPEQLQRLQRAHMDVNAGDAAVAEARAKPAQELADQSERTLRLSRAIDDVLYGPQDDPRRAPRGSAYDLSNAAAREAWPSPRPAPGG